MLKRAEVEEYFKIYGFENRGGDGHDRLERPGGAWTLLVRQPEIDERLFAEMKRQVGLKR